MRANEQKNERVAQYFSLYSWLLWPTVVGEKGKNADLHHLSVVSLCLYPLDAGLSICPLLYLSVLMSLFSITSSVHPFLCPSCPSFFIMLRYIIYSLESLWNLLLVSQSAESLVRNSAPMPRIEGEMEDRHVVPWPTHGVTSFQILGRRVLAVAG